MSARDRSRFLTTAVVFLLAFGVIGLLVFRSMRALAQSYTFRPTASISNTYNGGVASTTNLGGAYDADLNTAANTYTNADFGEDGFGTPDTVFTWSARWSAFNQTVFFIRAVGLYVERSGTLNSSNQWKIEYSLNGISGPWNVLDDDSISGANPTKAAVSTMSIPDDFDVENNLQVRTSTRQQNATDALLNIYDIRVEADWNTVTGGWEPLRIATTSLPDGDRYVAYDEIVDAIGGNLPYTWSIILGNLPPQFSGADTGSPNYDYRITYGGSLPNITTPGVYNFTLRVTDSSTPAQTADKALSITIPGLAIFPQNSNITIEVSTPYTVGFTPCNPSTPCGVAPYKWCLVSGSIPPGMSFSPSLSACPTTTTSSGISLTGTPSNAGIYTFTLRLTDSSPETTEKQYSINVTGGTRIIPPTLRKMIKGIWYGKNNPAGYTPMNAQQLTAVNVIYSTYSWSSSGLPSGLSLGDLTYNAADDVSRASIVGKMPVNTPSGDYLFSATINDPPATSNTVNNIRLTVADRKTVFVKTPPSTAHLGSNGELSFTVFAEGGVPSDSDPVTDTDVSRDGHKVPYYNFTWQISPVAGTSSPDLDSAYANGSTTDIVSSPQKMDLTFKDAAGHAVTGTYDVKFWARDYLTRHPDPSPPPASAYTFTPATARITVIAAGGGTLERETGGKTKLRQEQFR